MSDRKPPCFSSAGELGVGCFTVVYMLISLIAALRGNPEFVFYLVIMCVLIAATLLVHWKINLQLGALWGLSSWGLAHMCGGLMPIPESWPSDGDTLVLYNLWLVPNTLKYDQVVHAFGFGLVTWICWQGVRSALAQHVSSPKPTVGLLILCVAAGMGFGAANEVVEFAATLILPRTNVGGYINTGWDLVANLVGCLLAAILIFLKHSTDGKPRQALNFR